MKKYGIKFRDDESTFVTLDSIRNIKHISSKCIRIYTQLGTTIDLTYNMDGYPQMIYDDLCSLETYFPWFHKVDKFI